MSRAPSPHIVVFNAPPRSGKDECAKILSEEYGFALDRFSAPLKAAVCALFGITLAELEECKETETEALFWMTGREAQIWLSEKVMKPKLGGDVFGRLMGRRIAHAHEHRISQNLFAIPDSGFMPELDGMLYELKGLDPKVIVVQLTRPDYTFERFDDSRRYLDVLMLKARNVPCVQMPNDGSLEDLHSSLRQMARGWEWMEWKDCRGWTVAERRKGEKG